jgi:uncharacterized protein YndB with AHSA1/START domain
MPGIQLRFSYPVTPEHIWRALTDPSQIIRWMTATGFTPAAGQRFTFWPSAQPGLHPGVRAVIREIAGPTRSIPGRLVMDWENDQFQCIVTLLVKPAWRGCRLDVVQSSVPGSDDTDSHWLVEACRHLFGQQLRALVTGAVEKADAPGRIWFSLRGHWRVIVAVLAMLLVVGGATAAFVLLPVHRPLTTLGPAPSTQNPAPSTQNSATPTLGGTAPSAVPTQSGPTARPAGPGPAGGPGSGPPALPAAVGPGQLTAAYTTTADGPLRTFVDVLVTNDGGSTKTGWTTALILDGVNLIVSSNSNEVTQSVQGSTYRFTPTAETETVMPGRSVAFRVTVTGLLTGVRSCTIDERTCVPA